MMNSNTLICSDSCAQDFCLLLIFVIFILLRMCASKPSYTIIATPDTIEQCAITRNKPYLALLQIVISNTTVVCSLALIRHHHIHIEACASNYGWWTGQ